MVLHADRRAAGLSLAQAVEGGWTGAGRPVVLGLPRGGVPVAAPVAAALHADLDVLPVRKISVPGQPELAMGAVAEGGITVVDERIRSRVRIGEQEFADRAAAAASELAERGVRWRSGRAAVPLAGRDVVLVDDGLATGATARAAVRAAVAAGARSVTVAAPVGSADAVALLRAEGAEVVCPSVPARFRAVGMHYRDFGQTSDAAVIALLAQARPDPP